MESGIEVDAHGDDEGGEGDERENEGPGAVKKLVPKIKSIS